MQMTFGTTPSYQQRVLGALYVNPQSFTVYELQFGNSVGYLLALMFAVNNHPLVALSVV